MGVQDVAFLPCRASIPTTFHKNCGRGERLMTTMSQNCGSGVSKVMLPVRYAPTKPLFVSVEIHQDHKIVTK